MKKKKAVKATKSKSTKNKSKIQVYGYVIERDFMIITGGGLAIMLMLVIFVF